MGNCLRGVLRRGPIINPDTPHLHPLPPGPVHHHHHRSVLCITPEAQRRIPYVCVPLDDIQDSEGYQSQSSTPNRPSTGKSRVGDQDVDQDQVQDHVQLIIGHVDVNSDDAVDINHDLNNNNRVVAPNELEDVKDAKSLLKFVRGNGGATRVTLGPFQTSEITPAKVYLVGFVGDIGVGYINEGLTRIPHNLQELTLTSANISHRGAEALSSILSSNLELRTLNLSYNHLTGEGMRSIQVSLAQLSHLETLNLVGTTLRADGAGALNTALLYISTLKVIDIDSNAIEAAGLQSLKEGLLKQRNTLTVLSVAGNLLGLDGADTLNEILKQCPLIVELAIDDNTFGDSGIVTLQPGLGSLRNLQKLSVGCNKIGVLGAEKLNEVLRYHVHSLRSLTLEANNLRADGIEALGPGISQQQQLQHLNVKNNKIPPRGARELAQILSQLPSLQALLAEVNQMTDDSLALLFESVSPFASMQEIHLAGNAHKDQRQSPKVQGRLFQALGDFIGNQDNQHKLHLTIHPDFHRHVKTTAAQSAVDVVIENADD